jgi:hypothetical protein
MSASFKTGLECRHCKKHNPDRKVNKQWGTNSGNNLIDLPDVALRVDGVILCCKCGTTLGADDDKHMPDQVARIIRRLVQDAFFAVRGITDQDVGVPFVWLENRVLPGVKCQIKWFRDVRFVEDVPSTATRLPSQSYDPSELKVRHSPIIERAVYALIEDGVSVTELPKRDVGYINMGMIINRHDARIEPLRDPEALNDPDNPRQVESLLAPIIIEMQLQWKPDLAPATPESR